MRGFIKGMAVGLLSFALGFSVLSIVFDRAFPPEMPVAAPESTPVAPVTESPTQDEDTFAGVAEDAAAEALSTPEPAPQTTPTPPVETVSEPASAPQLDVLAEPEDVAPATGPEDVAPATGNAVASDDPAPESAPETNTFDTATAAPVADPSAEQAEVTATDEVSQADTGPMPAEVASQSPEAMTPDADNADTPPQPAPGPMTAEPDPAPEAAQEPEVAIEPAPEPAPARETATAQEPATEPSSEPSAESAAELDLEAPVDPGNDARDENGVDQGPTSEPDPDTAAAAPPVLRAVPPSPGLNREVAGVTVGRLPSISPTEAPTMPQEIAEPAEVDPQSLPARLRYAAPFETAPGPQFAVILLDAPADPSAEAAILALPMPVAVALDPQDPDAPRRAVAYRAAGHEIVMLAAGLPAGATPSDLEVTFDAWFRALPETVALLDPPEGGFQGDRGLAQAIMPFLTADGHGLVTYDRGLNPAQQSASSAGVASAMVFRIIDSGDENQFTIRRYLDRATFRAQQEGRVVVMGRAAHAETIAGLIGWRMEGRAGQVAIVPVSATLRLP